MNQVQEKYFEVPYISASFLKDLKGGYMPPNISEVFYFGSQFHYSILEPEKLDLSYDHLGKIYEMRDEFFKDELCKAIILHPNFKREHEVYKTFRGIKAKCKFDGLVKELSFGFELKGLSVRTHNTFLSSIDRFDYDLSSAWYMDLSGIDNHLIVGVSKVNFKLFKFIVKRGDHIYNRGKEKYEQCLRMYLEQSNKQ